jgi:hypothetical protein
MADGLSASDYRFFMEKAAEGVHPREPDYPRFMALRQQHIAWLGEEDVERVAVHEAGHAIVAYELGWSVNELVVAKARGHVWSGYPLDVGPGVGAAAERIRQWVRQKVAGVVAEEIRWGMAREPETDLLGAVVDCYHALITQATTPDDRNALAQVFADRPSGGSLSDLGHALILAEAEQARALLRSRWTEVEVVAEELVGIVERSSDGTGRMSRETFQSLIAR